MVKPDDPRNVEFDRLKCGAQQYVENSPHSIGYGMVNQDHSPVLTSHYDSTAPVLAAH